MENKSFLIARRRNAQTRNGASWLHRLEEATGIRSQLRLLEAAESIARESRKLDTVRHGLTDGKVVRLSECSQAEATVIWDSALRLVADQLVVCDLVHHPDFSFLVAAKQLVGKMEALLAFDGDTVAIGSVELTWGVVVDVHHDDGQAVYEVDRWATG